MLRLYIIIIAFLMAIQSEGQTFTKIFSGGSDLLQYTNITPASAGGWLATGIARTNTGFITYISKFDDDGNLLWSQKPGDTRDARALVTLDDGSALVFNNNNGFQGYFDASMLHIGANENFISEIIWREVQIPTAAPIPPRSRSMYNSLARFSYPISLVRKAIIILTTTFSGYLATPLRPQDSCYRSIRGGESWFLNPTIRWNSGMETSGISPLLLVSIGISFK
jgi:hypothetical protein